MLKVERQSTIERIDAVIDHILDMMPSALEDMSGRELAVSFGIFVDKRQLLLGHATEITENKNMNIIVKYE